MFASRAALRTSRAVRVNSPAVKRNVRFASDNASSSAGSGSSHAVSGLAGGSLVLLGGYAWYHFSGVKTAVQTAHATKSYIDSATDQFKVKFQEVTPSSNEVIESLKQEAHKYARFIPGGRDYVDSAFRDVDSIREKHADEVDKILREAYGELRDVSRKGLSLETATQSWDVISKHLQRLGSLAGDAAQSIMDNHPGLKDKLGGNVDQLKQLGDKLGPEAKKQVDETWKEVSDIAKQGLQADSLNRIRKLIQDKTQQIQKLGEEAWNKGYEQLKPTLDKNPQIKKLVEENQDLLKSGSATEVVAKVKDAVSSGSTGDLEKYIQSAKDQASKVSSSSGLSDWLDKVPGGSQIIPQLTQLKEIAEKQSPKAEKLLNETMEDLKKVFEKRKGQVEELYNESKEKADKGS